MRDTKIASTIVQVHWSTVWYHEAKSWTFCAKFYIVMHRQSDRLSVSGRECTSWTILVMIILIILLITTQSHCVATCKCNDLVAKSGWQVKGRSLQSVSFYQLERTESLLFAVFVGRRFREVGQAQKLITLQAISKHNIMLCIASMQNRSRNR